MKIYGFKAKIKNIDYKELEKKGLANKIFLAQVQISEIRRGKTHKDVRHNATLYLTKEQYDEKLLEVGDIIELNDGVKFLPTLVNFNVYDEKKLKAYSAAKIRTDTNGRPYAPQKAFAYHISAIEGSWKLVTKFNEIFYWQFGSLKIPMNDGETPEECEAEFRDTTEYAFYLDENEFNKVKEYEGTYIINGYKQKALVIKQPFDIQFEKVDNIDKWKVTMTKIEG